MLPRLKNKIKSRMKDEQELKEKFSDVEFEKGDAFAMFIAAIITFIPPFLICLLVIYGVLWLLFLR